MQNDYNVASLSYADIRPCYGTFRTCHVSGEGRYKVHKSVIGVMTGIGDIEESVWRKLAMDVIAYKGDGEEFRKKHEYVKRHKKYNQCKTETDLLQKTLDLFLFEKIYPDEWAATRSRKRFASQADFDTLPDYHGLAWLNATAEVMEDGSEWVAVITALGEIQEDLWVDLSLRLIKQGGHGHMLISEITRLRESYARLLANGRVDDRFIKTQAIQGVVRALAGSTVERD